MAKKSFFVKFIDKIKLKKSNKQYQEMISLLRKHPKFSAYKSEFVNFLTHIIWEKDPDICVFLADCDNLRISNEIAQKKAEQINLETMERLGLQDISFLDNPVTGEQIIDKDIQAILLQLKSINKMYNYENALLGVNGDEIIISIPHCKPEDRQKLYEEYSRSSFWLNYY